MHQQFAGKHEPRFRGARQLSRYGQPESAAAAARGPVCNGHRPGGWRQRRAPAGQQHVSAPPAPRPLHVGRQWRRRAAGLWRGGASIAANCTGVHRASSAAFGHCKCNPQRFTHHIDPLSWLLFYPNQLLFLLAPPPPSFLPSTNQNFLFAPQNPSPADQRPDHDDQRNELGPK